MNNSCSNDSNPSATPQLSRLLKNPYLSNLLPRTLETLRQGLPPHAQRQFAENAETHPASHNPHSLLLASSNRLQNLLDSSPSHPQQQMQPATQVSAGDNNTVRKKPAAAPSAKLSQVKLTILKRRVHNRKPKVPKDLLKQQPAATSQTLAQNSGSATGASEQCIDPKAAIVEMNALILTIVGLDGVKLQLSKWIKGLVLYDKRKTLGLQVGPRKALHMAFLGNPGTGKTMVARLLGKILHKLGLIATDKVTEVQRTDLVGEYVGQTGPKTRNKLDEARGGILFVDEAYRLMPPDSKKDFGREALEEIMSAMDRGDIITIFAGYSEQMMRVVSANPGFARRVTKFFNFDDYGPRDIAMILHSKINTQKEDSFLYGFKLHSDCTVEAVAGLITEHTTYEQLKKMNGGLVDPWLVNALENLDLRLDVDCIDADTLTTITMKDLEEGLKSLSDCN